MDTQFNYSKYIAISQGIIQGIQANPHIDDSLYMYIFWIGKGKKKETKHALVQIYAFEERKEFCRRTTFK